MMQPPFSHNQTLDILNIGKSQFQYFKGPTGFLKLNSSAGQSGTGNRQYLDFADLLTAYLGSELFKTGMKKEFLKAIFEAIAQFRKSKEVQEISERESVFDFKYHPNSNLPWGISLAIEDWEKVHADHGDFITIKITYRNLDFTRHLNYQPLLQRYGDREAKSMMLQSMQLKKKSVTDQPRFLMELNLTKYHLLLKNKLKTQ